MEDPAIVHVLNVNQILYSSYQGISSQQLVNP